jgi:hypothetical protein
MTRATPDKLEQRLLMVTESLEQALADLTRVIADVRSPAEPAPDQPAQPPAEHEHPEGQENH